MPNFFHKWTQLFPEKLFRLSEISIPNFDTPNKQVEIFANQNIYAPTQTLNQCAAFDQKTVSPNIYTFWKRVQFVQVSPKFLAPPNLEFLTCWAQYFKLDGHSLFIILNP